MASPDCLVGGVEQCEDTADFFEGDVSDHRGGVDSPPRSPRPPSTRFPHSPRSPSAHSPPPTAPQSPKHAPGTPVANIGSSQGPGTDAPSEPPPLLPMVLMKTELCRHYAAKKRCPMKEGVCKFAHGWDELDTKVAKCPFPTCSGKALRSESEYEEHMAVHRRQPGESGKAALTCTVCSRVCNSKKQLEEHMEAHRNRGEMDGESEASSGRRGGGRETNAWQKLRLCSHYSLNRACPVEGLCNFAHGWEELDARSAPCPMRHCDQILSSEQQFLEHMDRKHLTRVAAEERGDQGEGGWKRTSLCRHFSKGRQCPVDDGTCRFAHGWAELDVESTLCPYDCGTRLTSEAQYQQHMAAAHQKAICPTCGKTCSSKRQLREHMREHGQVNRKRGDPAPDRSGGKRRLCRHFTCGKVCPVEEGTCKFAHGWVDLDVESAECPFDGCGVEIESESQYDEHMSLCHQLVTCPVCKKMCSAHQITEHLDVHQRKGDADGIAPQNGVRRRTLLCRHFFRGRCSFVNCKFARCKFAHGWSELDAEFTKCPFEACGIDLYSEAQFEDHLAQHHAEDVGNPRDDERSDALGAPALLQEPARVRLSPVPGGAVVPAAAVAPAATEPAPTASAAWSEFNGYTTSVPSSTELAALQMMANMRVQLQRMQEVVGGMGGGPRAEAPDVRADAPRPAPDPPAAVATAPASQPHSQQPSTIAELAQMMAALQETVRRMEQQRSGQP